MATEPFFERFKRLVAPYVERRGGLAEIEVATGLSRDKIKRLSDGRTDMCRLDDGLRLAKFLGVSPYYLACLPEPSLSVVPEMQTVVATPQGRAGSAPPATVDPIVRIAELEAGLARVNERLDMLVSPQPVVEKNPRRPARRKQ